MITNKLKLSVDPANLPESYPDLLDCKFVTAAVKHKRDSYSAKNSILVKGLYK